MQNWLEYCKMFENAICMKLNIKPSKSTQGFLKSKLNQKPQFLSTLWPIFSILPSVDIVFMETCPILDLHLLKRLFTFWTTVVLLHSSNLPLVLLI